MLNAIIQLADADGFQDSIREASPNLTPDEVDAAYALGVVFTVLIGLIFAALYLLLAIQVRKGKNWARIVTWVLAGLGVLGGLLGLAGDGTGARAGCSASIVHAASTRRSSCCWRCGRRTSTSRRGRRLATRTGLSEEVQRGPGAVEHPARVGAQDPLEQRRRRPTGSRW